MLLRFRLKVWGPDKWGGETRGGNICEEQGPPPCQDRKAGGNVHRSKFHWAGTAKGVFKRATMELHFRADGVTSKLAVKSAAWNCFLTMILWKSRRVQPWSPASIQSRERRAGGDTRHRSRTQHCQEARVKWGWEKPCHETPHCYRKNAGLSTLCVRRNQDYFHLNMKVKMI